MSAAAEQLASEALTLSEAERAQLAQTLLQSLEPADENVEQAWEAEVGHRLERVRQGNAHGQPATDVFRESGLALLS